MSGSIKLKHASGNGVIISAPSSNPASDRTLTLPSDADGTIARTLDVKIKSYALIADVKSSNADGGSLTSGAWRTRDLNAEISDADSIVSISSNQFTLQAGNYLIKWSAPAYRVSSHQTRLYNITTSANVQHGSCSYTHTTDLTTPQSTGVARIALSGSTVFEIQQRSYASKSTNGLGVGSSGGVDWCGSATTDGCVFCQVEIFKES